MKKNIVIFGAGNIGRSFIGQLFSRSGYAVTFIDTNKKLVARLNETGRYNIILKKDNARDRILTVSPVTAIDGENREDVVGALRKADLVATSVGLRALPYVITPICNALWERRKRGERGFDIILAENINNGKEFFLREAAKYLPEVLLSSGIMGIVECSIGKMVPIMKEADLAKDPLQLFAEEYDTLIVDGKGFINGYPEIEGLKPVANIKAYVDRKLYIHNLGHAAAAYFGYLYGGNYHLIADVMGNPEVYGRVLKVMTDASLMLQSLYPDDFSQESMIHHVADLIGRFGNKALGDTVFRIGRDLGRKLHRDDRVLGAAIKAVEAGNSYESFLDVFRAGLMFRATDENGFLFPGDSLFINEAEKMSPAEAAVSLCGLSPHNPVDAQLLRILNNQNTFSKEKTHVKF